MDPSAFVYATRADDVTAALRPAAAPGSTSLGAASASVYASPRIDDVTAESRPVEVTKSRPPNQIDRIRDYGTNYKDLSVALRSAVGDTPQVAHYEHCAFIAQSAHDSYIRRLTTGYYRSAKDKARQAKDAAHAAVNSATLSLGTDLESETFSEIKASLEQLESYLLSIPFILDHEAMIFSRLR